MVMNSNFSFLPAEQAMALSRKVDDNMYVARVEDQLVALFYRGIISNFYMARIQLNDGVLELFYSRQQTPVDRFRMRDFHQVVNAMMNDFNRAPSFRCGEQFIMACKAYLCGDLEQGRQIIEANLPARKYKDMGRAVKNFNTFAARWNVLREVVAEFIITYRYLYQSEFASLIDTVFDVARADPTLCNIHFYEASPPDRIWGVGMDEYQSHAQIRQNGLKNWNKMHGRKVFTVGFENFITKYFKE